MGKVSGRMVAAAAGLLLPITAAAQSPVPVPAPPPPPPPPVVVLQSAPSRYPSPSPRQLELGRTLVELLPVDAQIEQVLRQGMPMMTRSIVGSIRSDPSTAAIARLLDQPGVQDRFERILGEEFMTAMRSHLPEMHAEGAQIYARNFSEEDLTQIIAFYRTPVGHRLIELQPQLQQAMSAAGQRIGRLAGQEAMGRTLQRMSAADRRAPTS